MQNSKRYGSIFIWVSKIIFGMLAIYTSHYPKIIINRASSLYLLTSRWLVYLNF